MTAPAVVSWAAHLGWINLSQTPLAFLGYTATPYILSALALGEFVTDKLPTTPSRKALIGFGARIVTGIVSGYALALGLGESGISGAVLGCLGAIAGTLGGYEARTRLSRAWGNGFAVALLEDAIAIAIGLAAVHYNKF